MRRRSIAARPARLALVLALGIAGGMLEVTPAAAQMAAALGKPLPSPDLPVGTVSVRIVAGSAASPVVGTTVTLIVNDAPREARTDSAGRATFAGLPPGASVVAKVTDADKAEHASDVFTVPESGGARVMITTKPWQAGAGGGAPFAGGGAGMPNPRQLSGESRPDQNDPAGTITVRAAYDDFKDAPEGAPVALVGYSADDTTSVQILKADKVGHAVFRGLDRSSGTAYFAMMLLPRNGATDRLISMPIVLESQVGVRTILSSEKRDSKAPPIDDLAKGDPQVGTPAGKVLVAIEGIADLTSTVRLVDAATKKVLGETRPERSAPDPQRVTGGAQFDADPKLPAGTLDVVVVGGPGQTEEPLKGIEIRVIAASSKDASGGLASVTGDDGTLRMALKVTEPQKAVFAINGRQLASQPFEIAKQGGKLVIRAHWDDSGRPQAVFDVPGAEEGQIVYAECAFRNQHWRSLPFQLLAAAGTKISIYAFPRVMFRFQLHAFVEDQLLAAQGRFEVSNYSWAPYRAGPDGLVVPMPKNFKGGVVFDPDQNEVAVAQGEGFRIIRPIPPGGRAFHGGFSLPVEHGKVGWALDLPMGLYESEFDIRQTPGMTVHTPQGVNGDVRTVPQGTFYVMDSISITPKQSMVMTIEGLPSEPSWRLWVPRVVGVLVVGLMMAGVGFALFFRKQGRPTVASSEARRQRLLDELTELERTGGNPKRREQLLDELTDLWT
ncbi:MAG TPA: carboxypeptidase-like regulatory domain-containing protein [Kofleriaceae bacterium]|nr:carboxypeptidase-like regulatory domain-containing protein [Kofleriaceae bacterium]